MKAKRPASAGQPIRHTGNRGPAGPTNPATVGFTELARSAAPESEDERRRLEVKEARVLDTLIREYDNVSQELRARIVTNTSIVGFGVTTVGGGFAYALSQRNHELLIMLPLALFGVLLFALFNATGIMLLGGYRHHLEERLNEILQERVLIWEDVVKSLRHYGFATLSFYVFCVVLFLVIASFSLYRLFRIGIPYLICGGITLLVVGWVLVEGTRRLNSAFDASFNAAGTEARGG
jgi:hypothetical protein